MTDGSTTWSFAYDVNGLRTSRTNGSTAYNYIYNGGSLSKMTVGNNTLYFTYGAEGHPLTLTCNGTTYFYATNLQGDVVAILNASGTPVVRYTYDAWGNALTVTDTSNISLATLNPLRYRGYVYDSETGLYYLQSRYYDPEIGRFLNADAFVSTGQGQLGNNMFAYCNNNPGVGADPTGTWLDTFIDIVSFADSFARLIRDPLDKWNQIGFFADAVDLVVPYVSGLGEVSRGVRLGRHASEAAFDATNIALKGYRRLTQASEGLGGLSRAVEFGISSYKNLRKATSGTGLEAHHIIEQRFLKGWGKNCNEALCVAVTKMEHYRFTEQWRKLIPYGTDYSRLSKDKVWEAAQQVYNGYPALLAAAWYTIFGPE